MKTKKDLHTTLSGVLRAVAAFIMSAYLLPAHAYADVANGGMYAVAVGIPVLLIALAVILIAMLIRAIRRKK